MLARGVARRPASAFHSRLPPRVAAAPSSSRSARRALLRTAPALLSPDGGGAADANFILHTKEHAQGGGRNELHYAQCDDSVADVVCRRQTLSRSLTDDRGPH
eukprot:COSAG04_NODE_5063_length_1759_cov_11.585542_2_plen_103_part_00